jgi:PTH1 family peptidyl-tRNA hydrolase
MVLDRVAARAGISMTKRLAQAEVGKGRFAATEVVLAKPLTYMNLSGQSVGELLRWFKLGPSDLVVIHDDLDLPPGRPKLSSDSSSAGHKGVGSIIAHLGRQDFIRLRLGIGRPEEDGQAVEDFVLKPFRAEEWRLVEPALEQTVDALERVLTVGLLQAQTEFNAARKTETG